MNLKDLDMIKHIIYSKDIKSYKDFISLLNEKKEEYMKECFHIPSNKDLIWYIYRD